MSAQRVLATLKERGLKLAVAESLTGGALSSEFVSVPGASDSFLGSVVAYSTALKQAILGVDAGLLASRGAVDPDVASAMAHGVRAALAGAASLPSSRVIGLAVTGVAGPDPQDSKPVGTVFIAVAGPEDGRVYVRALALDGTRSQIRTASVDAALALLEESLGPHFWEQK